MRAKLKMNILRGAMSAVMRFDCRFNHGKFSGHCHFVLPTFFLSYMLEEQSVWQPNQGKTARFWIYTTVPLSRNLLLHKIWNLLAEIENSAIKPLNWLHLCLMSKENQHTRPREIGKGYRRNISLRKSFITIKKRKKQLLARYVSYIM